MIDEDIEEEVQEEITNLEETIDKELNSGQNMYTPGESNELLEMPERGPTNKKRFLPFFNRIQKGDTCDKKELTSPVRILTIFFCLKLTYPVSTIPY